MKSNNNERYCSGNFMYYSVNTYPEDSFICPDNLTYAGNPETLASLEGKPNNKFVKGDIADRKLVFDFFEQEKPADVFSNGSLCRWQSSSKPHTDSTINKVPEVMQPEG